MRPLLPILAIFWRLSRTSKRSSARRWQKGLSEHRRDVGRAATAMLEADRWKMRKLPHGSSVCENALMSYNMARRAGAYLTNSTVRWDSAASYRRRARPARAWRAHRSLGRSRKPDRRYAEPLAQSHRCRPERRAVPDVQGRHSHGLPLGLGERRGAAGGLQLDEHPAVLDCEGPVGHGLGRGGLRVDRDARGTTATSSIGRGRSTSHQ
jgi:hypothetical protein